MALPSLNPRFVETLQATAGARIAREVHQKLSPTSVKRIQQILQLTDFVDGALGLSGDFAAAAQPLLGGVSMDYAKDIFAQMNAAQLSRKNLFVIEVTDHNPPDLNYEPRPAGATAASSAIGEVLDTGRKLLGGGLSGLISQGLKGLTRGLPGLGGTTGLGAGVDSQPNPGKMFNLFATSVSYGPNTMVGEKISFGSATSDRLNGTEATEMQITTMDDEVGTLKRWFDGKCAQAAHPDGTFGLPRDYLVDIAIYHAVVKPDARAFKFHAKMRPQAVTHELSRSEQAMQEIQFSFSQFDSFMKPRP